MSQILIYPATIPNGANLIFPAFSGKIIGGQVQMDINVPLCGSPNVRGTFYPTGGFNYLRMVRMQINEVTYSLTKQLAIFLESPEYTVDGSFALELNVTPDENDTTNLYTVNQSPGKQSFLVVEK